MLTFEQIKELIELVASHRLTGIELERSGFRLKIEGEPPGVLAGAPPLAATSPRLRIPPAAQETGESAAVEPVAVGGPETSAAAAPAGAALSRQPAAPATAAAPGAEPSRSAGPPADAHVVHSPIVGTFYAAPNPDAKPFVRIGDRVEQGQVLCIVEAMKLMNEIESDVDGVVLEIYPQNAQPVEYGEPLFAIRPG